MAAVVAGGMAHAADMPLKAAPIAHPCAADQWKGFYIGGSVGGAYHRADRQDINLNISGPGTYINTTSGVAVGGQAGYNWGSCNVVYGIEADGMWADVNRFRLSNPVAGAVPLAAQFELGGVTTKLDAVLTLRGRTGIALDSVLLYITGGAAAINTSTTYTHIHANGTENIRFDISDWRWGWVAGFGAEWAWTRNLSLRSEFLYIGTPDKDYAKLSSINQNGLNFISNFSHNDAVFISRVGMNYRF